MGQDLKEALDLCRGGRWDDAHKIVQKNDSNWAFWLHAIIHREEGDLSNARYWYSRAGRAFSKTTITDELAHFEQVLSKRNDIGDAE
ncbi:MAG: hypothetical protein CMK60_11650 [Proteobacteria bacterium]|jgi:hypothetical protein|nr:hypothetical protein [Pseudomonadota bacterium]MBP10191.1 hypothetical protein [Acidiferrobacteraceae bacterium]MDP6135230.1 hypothetical protein [Arenicellales bacterium]MDP6652739.1 hypothetical protein [Gammaproteobacteria bacterium]HCF74229.1 hypothetical protein [Gammaproteobacteria bacterium]|tara:strand:- start:7745 stop:8005 length:261 start_codon:yes stop_codon:yes gene_type:complete